MKQAPNDPSRWFVVEQGGLIRVFDNDPDVASMQDFVDLRTRVQFSGETGLLGLAFHPGLRHERPCLSQFQRAGGRSHPLRDRGIHES